MVIHADEEAEVSVGGKESIRVVVISELGACKRDEVAIYLESLEMAGRVRVGCEEEENVCQSQQVPVGPGEFEAKSAVKKWESQYERHARSAEPEENASALSALVDSCFHGEIWGRCLWAESIHVVQTSRVPEKYTFPVSQTEVSVPDDHQLAKALDLFWQEKVSVDGLPHSQET